MQLTTFPPIFRAEAESLTNSLHLETQEEGSSGNSSAKNLIPVIVFLKELPGNAAGSIKLPLLIGQPSGGM